MRYDHIEVVRRQRVSRVWRIRHSKEQYRLYQYFGLVRYNCVKKLNCAGHIIRTVVNKIPKRILERSDGGRRHTEIRRTGGRMKWDRISPNCSIRENGAQVQDIGVIGERKQGIPWPGNRSKIHRKNRRSKRWRKRRRRRRKEEEEELAFFNLL